ncbi:hypothetical protein Ddye_014050 [Dipteronia dyeriana]|uniref:DUF1985 domain-containing protein n=1 Tax=Dipteronia dyeriana TaxID=168575 RepID=A0AAD9X7H8_9ROSI|nr:hypothetical protein Ddye_014050 [Dipteronia dyeriana]
MQREMKFSTGIVHQLLMHELHHDGTEDEMRFMIGYHLIWFSKVEFYFITGLKFKVIPDSMRYDLVENSIHHRYFDGLDEVDYEQLIAVLWIVIFEQQYNAVKLCLLYILNWILMGLDEKEKILVWQIRLVEDLDTFDVFPWGAQVIGSHVLDDRREQLEN